MDQSAENEDLCSAKDLLDSTLYADLNELLLDLDAKIRSYELRYGLETQDMREQLSTGGRAETDDLLDWLNLDNRRRFIELYGTERV